VTLGKLFRDVRSAIPARKILSCTLLGCSSVDGVSRNYDAVGNTTRVALQGRNRYDDAYRLKNIGNRDAQYNALGQRVGKMAAIWQPGNSLQFVYDEAGHLVGEYDGNGVVVKQYVWLDDTLVGVMSSFDGSTYQFVETDHLGTPRAVVHPSKNVIVWRWDLNPTAFGEHAAAKNPDGDSLNYELNLRFPGQYYDSETGLNYNYFRDYDPATGRYLESDPIGLAGGISTYAYVRGRPISSIDPFGLVDLNLYPMTESNRHSADLYNSTNGAFTVGGHGNSSWMQDPDGRYLTPADLAALIKNHPKYHQGQTVEVWACNVGMETADGNNFAKALARELGVGRVAGPNDFIFFTKDGRQRPAIAPPLHSSVTEATYQPGQLDGAKPDLSKPGHLNYYGSQWVVP
jgi:RHS repeat-associated protein